MCAGDDGLSLSEVLASATTPTLEQLRTHASAVSAMSLADKDSSEDYVKTAGSHAHREHILNLVRVDI